MTAKFDLFMRLPDGQPIWIKAVERLEDARNELAQIAAHTPGNYFIFNASNGQLVPGNSFATGQPSLVHSAK
jgi:hypothetical protein